MLRIGLLQKEPIDFDQEVEVLEDALDSGDLILANQMSMSIAEQLDMTPRTFPGLFKLDVESFCIGVLRRARQVECVELI